VGKAFLDRVSDAAVAGVSAADAAPANADASDAEPA
jgi:hypothetical protein